MSTVSEFNAQSFTASFGNCLALTKPRVTALIVFTAVIGMFLATPGMVPLNILLAATIGIGMSSGAAAAFNHLIEQKIDAKMEVKNISMISSSWLSKLKYIGLSASVLVVVIYFISKNVNNSSANELAQSKKDSARGA